MASDWRLGDSRLSRIVISSESEKSFSFAVRRSMIGNSKREACYQEPFGHRPYTLAAKPPPTFLIRAELSSIISGRAVHRIPLSPSFFICIFPRSMLQYHHIPERQGQEIVERLLASREPLEGGKWQEHFIELILESQAEESRPCRNLTVIRQSAYFCRNMNKSGTANLSSLARRKIFFYCSKSGRLQRRK